MVVSLFLRRGPRRGFATPVVMAGAALALAGCTDSSPIPPYTYMYTPPAREGWPYRANGTYTPPVAYPRPGSSSPPSYSLIPRAEAALAIPPPLRPVAPDPPRMGFLPPVTFLTPPADATDCTGWWRICHFY